MEYPSAVSIWTLLRVIRFIRRGSPFRCCLVIERSVRRVFQPKQIVRENIEGRTKPWAARKHGVANHRHTDDRDFDTS